MINNSLNLVHLGRSDTALMGGSGFDQSCPVLGRFQCLEDGRRLEPTVHHAVGAPRVFTDTVFIQDILVGKLVNRLNMFVGKWITRLSPAHNRIGGV